MTPRSRERDPLVAISLVTFNGLRWLDRCIRSVLAQTLGDFELLVIDNASTDGTREYLRAGAPQLLDLTVFESDQNLGFAAAHNRNIEAARGDFVLLLNQDVELDSGFVEAAVAAFGNPLVAAVQGRLRALSPAGHRTDFLDSTGLEMRRDRRTVARRHGEREDCRDLVAGPVWGADGPAPMYRRSALIAVREPRTGGGWEVLDEDFFMYKEDVDLAWRLRRAGWQAFYEPRALAWHARSAGVARPDSVAQAIRSNWQIPRWIKSTSWRNQRLMQLKNESPREYLRDLPWILRRDLLSAGFMIIFDWPRLRAVLEFIRLAPRELRKRMPLSPADAARQVREFGPGTGDQRRHSDTPP